MNRVVVVIVAGGGGGGCGDVVAGLIVARCYSVASLVVRVIMCGGSSTITVVSSAKKGDFKIPCFNLSMEHFARNTFSKKCFAKSTYGSSKQSFTEKHSSKKISYILTSHHRGENKSNFN